MTELKAEALGLDFVSIENTMLAAPAHGWPQCECTLAGQMEYYVDLEMFFEYPDFQQDIHLTCKNCDLPVDLQNYLFAGGTVSGERLPMSIHWKSVVNNRAEDDPEIFGVIENG